MPASSLAERKQTWGVFGMLLSGALLLALILKSTDDDAALEDAVNATTEGSWGSASWGETLFVEENGTATMP